MKARLVRYEGEMKRQAFEIDGEATVGRAEDNTVVLDESAVSSHHARIGWDEAAGCHFIEDLESLNGTEVDGVRVRGAERLEGLHVVTLGRRLDLVFVPGAVSVAAAAAARTESEPVVTEEAPAEAAPAGAAREVLPGSRTSVGDEPLPIPANLGAEPELPGSKTQAESDPVSLPEGLRDPKGPDPKKPDPKGDGND